MDNDYLNEVLPRWQFWKERLIEQLVQYRKRLKEEFPEASEPKLQEDFDKIIEKTEKAETAESLNQAAEELDDFMGSL